MGKMSKTITFRIVLFCLLIFTCVICIAEEIGTGSVSVVGEKGENEVVIHAPMNVQPVKEGETEPKDGEKETKNNVEGENTENAENAGIFEGAEFDEIEELTKFLEKEKEYLQQLDNKYGSLLGDAAGEKNESSDSKEDETIGNAGKSKEKTEKMPDKPESGQAGTLGLGTGEKSNVVGETEKGEKEVEKGFAGAKDGNYSSPFETAEVFYEMGKFKEALDAYKSVSADIPKVRDYIWSQFQIGNCYRNLKNFDQAIKAYQSYINRYPDSFWAEQASWFIEDSKWWKSWNEKVRTEQ